MLEFLAQYGLFLLKALTVLFCILLVIAKLASLSQMGKDNAGRLQVDSINNKLEDYEEELKKSTLSKDEYKAYTKEKKKKEKEKEALKKKQLKNKNAPKNEDKEKTLYVLDFKGDIKAQQVQKLRVEITSLLLMADPKKDEVLIRLESPGGAVSGYGLAASELKRLKDHGIKLTVSVDQVAASGGYLMACLGDEIISAPFAMVGSIGVVASIPNFNKILKKNDVEFEQITAGKYKRTLTMFGENTEEGRKKFQEDIEGIHDLFKDFVSSARAQLNMDQVATGEFWFGKKALELKLVDRLLTSDEFILKAYKDQSKIYNVHYEPKPQSLKEKLLSPQGTLGQLAALMASKSLKESDLSKNNYQNIYF